jgi:hypothetical protein
MDSILSKNLKSSFPDRKDKTYFIITTSSILKKDKKEAFSFNSVIDYVVKPIPGDYIENLISNGYQRQRQMNNYNI